MTKRRKVLGVLAVGCLGVAVAACALDGCVKSKDRQARTMREFAEAEIVVPDGQYAGQKFKCDRQPYSRLWFELVDSGLWPRMFATGPSQSGKTLCCSITPVMYHIFEVGENVVFGMPDMAMAADKWRVDILPVIERSRYADLLPTKGAGSRGGKVVDVVRFKNGAELKFMSAGGGDKSRSHYSSRVLILTEVDGMDAAGQASREADPIEQMEARLRSYARAQRRVYGECTVSIETGRTWTEITGGTDTKIVGRCARCRKWVTPEREHLVGWKGCADEIEVEEKTHFACPNCGKKISDIQRGKMNAGARVLHRGQTMERGRVVGDLPRTRTLGFRWNQFNNSFAPAGDIGVDEWKAEKAEDRESAERKMCQFVWAVPHEPSVVDATPLSAEAIVRRMGGYPRGVVPDDAEWLTMGIDVGKHLTYWAVTAWRAGCRGHVVDYGRVEVPSLELGAERGVLNALRRLRDMALDGWAWTGGRYVPDQVWIDSAYMKDAVYPFCREMEPERFRPTKGFGLSQDMGVRVGGAYRQPVKVGPQVRHIGADYHFNKLENRRGLLVCVNVDVWKSFLHERLATPMGEAGAMALFETAGPEHIGFAKHMTAEKMQIEFLAGKGDVVRWVREHPNNHWFDCMVLCCAGAHFCGVRVLKAAPAPAVARAEGRAEKRFTREDGRPFLVAER